MPLSSGVVKLQRVTEEKLRKAQSFRKTMTEAEDVLWEKLRRKQIVGVKFRRQQIIEGFIADFFCEPAKLVVEVDGGIHTTIDQKAVDVHRKEVFEARGLKEIRFTNEQVKLGIGQVIKIIEEAVVARRGKD